MFILCKIELSNFAVSYRDILHIIAIYQISWVNENKDIDYLIVHVFVYMYPAQPQITSKQSQKAILKNMHNNLTLYQSYN